MLNPGDSTGRPTPSLKETIYSYILCPRNIQFWAVCALAPILLEPKLALTYRDDILIMYVTYEYFNHLFTLWSTFLTQQHTCGWNVLAISFFQPLNRNGNMVQSVLPKSVGYKLITTRLRCLFASQSSHFRFYITHFYSSKGLCKNNVRVYIAS